MDLPPVIELMTSECPSAALEPATLGRLAADPGFVREVKSQAEFAMESHADVPLREIGAGADLVVYPTGGLSPLSPHGKCQKPGCRLENAKSLARSVALYADYAVLSDFFTPLFLNFDAADDDLLGKVYADLLVLHALMPLIRKGILRFAEPMGGICKVHSREAWEVADRVAEQMWEFVIEDAKIEVLPLERTTWIALKSPLLSTAGAPYLIVRQLPTEAAESLFRRHQLSPGDAPPKGSLTELKSLFFDSIRQEIGGAFLESNRAAKHRAAIATDSRFETTALRILDEGKTHRAPPGDWERVRSLELPWVSSLTIPEVLQLREDASSALPRFRARMSKELFSLSGAVVDPAKHAATVVANLQEEVAELDAELRASKIMRGHLLPGALGLTGLGCIVYGVGSHDPTGLMAGAAIMSGLAAVHPAHKEAQAEHERLLSRPAYVLLAARELIKHRN